MSYLYFFSKWSVRANLSDGLWCINDSKEWHKGYFQSIKVSLLICGAYYYIPSNGRAALCFEFEKRKKLHGKIST